MKVLCLTQDFLPNSGGIAVFLHNLCEQLCHLRHQVDVLAPFSDGCAKADSRQPYRVYRYCSLKRLSSIVPICSTLKLYWQNHYDVLFIGHFMTTHSLGVLVLHKLWNMPFVILSHGSDLSYSISTRADKYVAGLLFHNVTFMLSNSRFTAERIRNADYSGPLAILNPGVDLERFNPDVDTAKVCQLYGLGERRVILTIARLEKRKNVDSVLRALPQVIKQVQNLLYLIVGNGEEKKRLERLSEELGLSAHVRFLGYVEDCLLPSLYKVSELFVLPSVQQDGSKDYEGFGIVFSEGSACGLPVIGGRSGGIVDAVIDGETGLLVDPHDMDEIAAAIIRLLTDRELAYRLGENGRRRVEQELSWEKVGDRLERYLKQVVERG